MIGDSPPDDDLDVGTDFTTQGPPIGLIIVVLLLVNLLFVTLLYQTMQDWLNGIIGQLSAAFDVAGP